MTLEKAVSPRKTRKARNELSRHFAVRRKLAKYSKRYKAVDRYPMGERVSPFKLLICFVFFVDQSRFLE